MNVMNVMNDARNSVLVVDDQESNIVVLTKILSPEYNVYATTDGCYAIKLAEKYLPDVILLDIVMFEMDGYAVITALKNSDITKNIPVIFITALSGSDDEEKGLALGAVDYISKPFSPAIIKLRLKNQIKMLEQLRTIERLSMFDQLTELPNRRSFENRLSAEWGRSLREQTQISLLMIDVDNFKNYNDTYGHQQGDVALQAFSKVLAQSLSRPGDFTARWGGEEFIMLLPNTSSVGALHVAEHVRECAEDMEIPTSNGSMTKLTISVGVNTHMQNYSGTIDNFLIGADIALYEAKNSGRNRVCCFKGI